MSFPLIWSGDRRGGFGRGQGGKQRGNVRVKRVGGLQVREERA